MEIVGRLALLLVGAFQMASCCSLAEMPRKYSMVETLELAPIVVSGTDVRHAEDTNGNAVRNYTFEVSCVFKSNNINIPQTIFLIDVGASTCHGTEMEEGESYVVALEKANADHLTRGDTSVQVPSDLSPYFIVFEPEAHNNAAYEIEDDTLMEVSRICDLDDRFESPRQGNACPARNVTTETCISKGISLRMAREEIFIGAMVTSFYILAQRIF